MTPSATRSSSAERQGRGPGMPSTIGTKMNNTSGLAELIERVERATEGGWELDADVAWEALGQDWSSGPERTVSEPTPHIELLPAYTASLDAALGLCKRALPSAYVGVQENRYPEGDGNDRTWNGYVQFGDDEHESSARPSPALALVLSTLKAIQQEQKT